MSEGLLLTGGRVVDPAQELDAKRDVRITGGVIEEIGRKLPARGARVIDVAGLVVCPGFIDLRARLREPGEEEKETIETGLRAAAAGGFTAVCAMPSTQPVNDSAGHTRSLLERALAVGGARLHPVAALSRARAGEELAEYGDLGGAGCVAIDDDGPVPSARLFRRALEYASAFDLPVVGGGQEASLSRDAAMHEGRVSTRLGLTGSPAAAEAIIADRDVSLAALTEGRLHIARLSTAAAADAVRRGKARGVRVTAEVAPHYLLLSDLAVGESAYDTATKLDPPLREEEDRIALLDALRDGTIDCLVSDHAPHHIDDKAVEFDRAAPGISSLEVAVALCLDRLVAAGEIALSDLVGLFSTAPARIFSLPGGSLAPGSPADVTVLDLERSRTVDPAAFQSKGRVTPFAGALLKGWPVLTLVAGRSVFDSRG
jgi:dihydroorotase